MSLFTSMFTGVSGLKVSQTSMNTVAHNLANVDTKGYTRQQIVTSPFSNVTISSNAIGLDQVGLGVNMAAIRQVRDVFLDQSYRLEIGRQGFYEKQWETAEEIESLFGEMQGTAFQEDLSDMWKAISELANEPDSLVKRGLVVSTANSFIDRAKIISTQMENYQVSLNKEVQTQVDRINEIGDQIQYLNDEIKKYEAGNERANDMRDARNLLLDELGGYANIQAKELINGGVDVYIEGKQFVTETKVYHIETEYIVTKEEQERAKQVKECADEISQKSTYADIVASDEWKQLKSLGNPSVVTNASGDVIRVDFDDYTLIDYTGTDVKVADVRPRTSNLLNVVWKESKAGDVFKMDGEYSTKKDRDVGSLKGLLLSMGSYKADYTDIPVKPNAKDFAGGETDPDYVAASRAYEKELEVYNKYVDASILMSSQAKFDQLIHSVVTAINDVLSPNTEINAESLKNLVLVEDGIEVAAANINLSSAKVTLSDGTVMDYKDVRIFDEYHSGTGMDEDSTVREGLFNRKNMERYTKAELSVEVNGATETYEVWVYNEENSYNVSSLFTIDQIEINSLVANNPSMLELSANQWSGYMEGFDYDICGKLLDAWKDKGIQLNPNSESYYDFADYYTAFADDLAFRGSTYKGIMEDEQKLVNDIDDTRQSYLGVSSDEELTNLIRYQHAYNASSRYINVVSEMLEHIINRLGA